MKHTESSSFVVYLSSCTGRRRFVESVRVLLFLYFSAYWWLHFPRSVLFYTGSCQTYRIMSNIQDHVKHTESISVSKMLYKSPCDNRGIYSEMRSCSAPARQMSGRPTVAGTDKFNSLIFIKSKTPLYWVITDQSASSTASVPTLPSSLFSRF